MPNAEHVAKSSNYPGVTQGYPPADFKLVAKAKGVVRKRPLGKFLEGKAPPKT